MEKEAVEEVLNGAVASQPPVEKEKESTREHEATRPNSPGERRAREGNKRGTGREKRGRGAEEPTNGTPSAAASPEGARPTYKRKTTTGGRGVVSAGS